MRRWGIGPVIPSKADERRNPPFDCPAYRQRNKAERLFSRLKQHRAIAAPYEKRATHDEVLVIIGGILFWL